MKITFSTIDNGARNRGVPYVHAQVGRTRVRYIERRDEDFIGWRCDECGDVECWHAEAVHDLLSRKIRDRMKHLAQVEVYSA